MQRTRAQGGTLVELVVAITVVTVAVASVLGALSSVAMHSSEDMVRAHAASIADAYLQEVLQRSFAVLAGSGARSNFDDIFDYDGLTDIGARDALGNAIAGLGSYTVMVTVNAGTLGTVPANQVRRVDVRVSHPSGVLVMVSGYRTRYP